ncbi:MAG TPA: hypothetical protein ENN95_00210 [Deltaproteobacteria bacterium]|nr:hypothetical protein [Deltaproteobacteria bacterium]
MKLKVGKKTAGNPGKFMAKISESRECLKVMTGEVEKKFFHRIKDWSKRDVKKLYNEYSVYIMIDELLQVIEKAAQRMQK